MALRPRESFSRPSVEDTSRPSELAHAFEAIADRVAVGDEARGGGVDVGIAVQEGGQGAQEIGLVLLVVGNERAHGLLVEALELGWIAHVRQQQLVGAGLLVGKLSPLGVALDHIEREHGLVVSALEIERVLDPAAATEGKREAGQARLELAEDGGGDATAGLPFGVGDKDDDFGRVGAGGDDRARGDGARAAGGHGEQAPAPVVLGGVAGVGANHGHAGARAEVGAELFAARDEIVAIVDAVREHGVLKARGGLLGGSLGSAHALDFGRDQSA